MILHLVNLTGFSGNTYFEPLTVHDLAFRIRSDLKPSEMFSMVSEQPVDFIWDDGFIEFKLDKLEVFDGVVINK